VTAIRYVVPGVSSSAFVPVPAATPAKISYKHAVTGQPGTQGIPVGPCEVSASVNGTVLQSGYSGGSGNMPPVFYPQLYFERSLSEVPPVSIYSDNQMPVPAVDPVGKAAVLAVPPRFLGQAQITQPKVLPRWANWLPTPDYGS
jgi:hypothetical protein